MHALYDTSTVHPLDRYDHYRAGARAEIAPVVAHGSAPGRLLARMSVAQIEDFEIEILTWSADSEITAQRTERLIRACDPECYRIVVNVNGDMRTEQAGNRVYYGARDIGLYDMSRPFLSTNLTGAGFMRVVMLTFPRALVPIAESRIRPLIGTLAPRCMPGRSVLAEFLIGLTDNSEPAADPDLADVLYECAVGLLRQQLDDPEGITPSLCRLLRLTRVQHIIRRHLADPSLDPDLIAKTANISPRYLHQLFQGAELTPMQLLKQLRLEECHRSLQDPALAKAPIKEVMGKHGYVRADQFARDFKRVFGLSATQVRSLAGQGPTGRNE